MKKTLLCYIILFLAFASTAQTSTVNYTSSAVDMPNPERGFYLPTITYASNYNPLVAADLASKRNYFTPFNANYQVHTTLVFRYFVLDDFVIDTITTDFLDLMQVDFDEARAAGVKLILRFSYTNTAPTGGCGSWICPPYGDATKARILEHLHKIGPYLQANKDIIATVQMGLIGVWGENYYTDHFGDASVSPFILTNTNWTDRNEVLGALLDAVPADRTVQVRYPQLKQRYVYGLGAPTDTAALTLAEAYSGSDKARIGFHNDCFLASDTDFGTYNDYGPLNSQSDTLNLKAYVEDDSQFVPVGGETCSANVNDPNDDDCAASGGRADSEMKRFHYSYLNSEYNNLDVNNDWTGTCMEDIKKNMGYRIQLNDGTYQNTAEAGTSMSITINLENVGYTAPFNPRGIELVLRETITGETYFAPLDIDPRLWSTGTHTITETVCLAPNVPAGSYELLLNLPDPEPTLFDDPDYAIQLANDNIWEAATGFNDLNHMIQITNTANAMTCYGGPMFTSTSVYDPDFCQNLLTIHNAISTDIYRADDKVISDGLVAPSEYIIFQAGNEIELNPGFEVESGALFWAIIKQCFE